MLRRMRSSIRRKVMLLVLSTTISALLLSAAGLVIYDLQSYEKNWTRDLDLQSEILARASAPALSFDDRDAAQKDLSLIRVRPNVLAAAIYSHSGELFATYVKAGEAVPEFPRAPGPDGYRISGDTLDLFHSVVERGEPLGTVYLHARYLPWARLTGRLAA